MMCKKSAELQTFTFGITFEIFAFDIAQKEVAVTLNLLSLTMKLLYYFYTITNLRL